MGAGELLWLQNNGKEGTAMLGMVYDRNVWHNIIVERIKEYVRRLRYGFGKNESTKKYAIGSVGARVRLMVRGGCLPVNGSKGMEIRC